MMNWIALGLWTLIVLIIVLPPQYDPAIMLKKLSEKWRDRE